MEKHNATLKRRAMKKKLINNSIGLALASHFHIIYL